MNLSEARGVIEALANGVDPRTGEVVESESILESSEVVRALHTALSAIDTQMSRRRRESRARDKDAKRRRVWQPDEERAVLNRVAEGDSILEIASAHGRTSTAIAARLVRLGLATDRKAAYMLNFSHGAKAAGNGEPSNLKCGLQLD
jgi:DNA-binding NarL/FixJ family response regulator